MLLFLSLTLYKEYMYVIPFNIGLFENPLASNISFRWLFLLFASVICLIPLFMRKKIGYLGLIFFIMVLLKPMIIQKIPKETAIEFFQKKQNDMSNLVEKYKNITKSRITNNEIESLGFEQIIIEGNNYIFITYDLLDSSHGFLYNKDDKPPKNILNSSTSLIKIAKN